MAALCPPKPDWSKAPGKVGANCAIGRVVKIAGGIGRVVVNSRRHHTLLERHGTGHDLDGTRGADHMAGHRLGRRDVRGARRILAECSLDARRLGRIVEFGRGAVSVDVEALRRLNVASATASDIARAIPAASGSGLVMW